VSQACRAMSAGAFRTGADRLRQVSEQISAVDAGGPVSGPVIGVIGGSGFYEFLDDAEDVGVETPYGRPSATISVGRVGDRPIAFLPRHGRGHQYPPHLINYRANLWALRAVGVRRVIAPCAVGSIRPELGPGALVVPDQLIDRTTDRAHTYVESGAVHVAFADPYCPDLRSQLCAADPKIVDGGTMVVVDGPRFSTRAESQWYAGFGWSLLNMTGYPEAVLARELAMCYASVALVTDRDAGVSEEDSVSQAEVFAEFGRNIDRLRGLLVTVISGLGDTAHCNCAHALDGISTGYTPP
jgi:5'-methylthioadenosine phosphorylase